MTAGTVDAELAEVEPLVRRICVRRLGPADGADAAQEVMLRLWRKAQDDEFRRDGQTLHGYATVLARYEAIHFYAARDRRPHQNLGEAAEHVFADDGPGPDEVVEHHIDAAAARERVDELLAELTPRLQQVVRASMATGWDTKAAAASCGLSPSGLRSAQVRAMAQLRAAAGVASANPLASGVPEVERVRARRRRAAVARRQLTPVRGCPGVGVQEVLDAFAA